MAQSVAGGTSGRRSGATRSGYSLVRGTDFVRHRRVMLQGQKISRESQVTGGGVPSDEVRADSAERYALNAQERQHPTAALLTVPAAAALALGIHLLAAKSEPPNESHTYTIVLGSFFAGAIVAAVMQRRWPALQTRMRRFRPLFTVGVLLLCVWELITSGFRMLPLPCFPDCHSGGVAEHFCRLVYGTWRILSHPRRGRKCWSQIRSRLVRELGARLGRVRKSLRGACHHGGIFLHGHDFAFQTAGPRPGLAKRNDSMVASSLRLRDVGKSFPAPDQPLTRRPVLETISVSLQAGELVSLVGPSGCGKSTLLRLIAALDFPDSGELLVDGQSIPGPSAERGLVFQDPNLFPWLTVRRNIEAGLAARGVLQQKSRVVSEIMSLVGLEAFVDAYQLQSSC